MFTHYHHHSHRGHHRSTNPNPTLLNDAHPTLSNENNQVHTHQDDDEHNDAIVSRTVNGSPAYEAEQQQYRSRRRSSVQFLDRKFIQSISNQSASSNPRDNVFTVAANTTDDACEL